MRPPVAAKLRSFRKFLQKLRMHRNQRLWEHVAMAMPQRERRECARRQAVRHIAAPMAMGESS